MSHSFTDRVCVLLPRSDPAAGTGGRLQGVSGAAGRPPGSAAQADGHGGHHGVHQVGDASSQPDQRTTGVQEGTTFISMFETRKSLQR